MNYLLIFEDGDMKVVDIIDENDKQSVFAGYLSIVDMKNNKYLNRQTQQWDDIRS